MAEAAPAVEILSAEKTYTTQFVKDLRVMP